MVELLEAKGLSANSKSADSADKLDVISRARKWPLYFVRQYPVTVADKPDDAYQITVGDKGIAINVVHHNLIAQTGLCMSPRPFPAPPCCHVFACEP